MSDVLGTTEDGVYRPSTADEIAVTKELRKLIKKQEEETAAKATAVASARAKLSALGLTDDEIAALGA